MPGCARCAAGPWAWPLQMWSRAIGTSFSACTCRADLITAGYYYSESPGASSALPAAPTTIIRALAVSLPLSPGARLSPHEPVSLLDRVRNGAATQPAGHPEGPPPPGRRTAGWRACRRAWSPPRSEDVTGASSMDGAAGQQGWSRGQPRPRAILRGERGAARSEPGKTGLYGSSTEPGHLTSVPRKGTGEGAGVGRKVRD